MKAKWILSFVVLSVANACLAGTLKSPDGQILLSFELRDFEGAKQCPTYSVFFKGNPLVAESRLGFDLKGGSALSDSFEVLSTDISKRDSRWKPVYGERSEIRDHYNQMRVSLSQKKFPALELVFRCYNSGVAMYYRIPKTEWREKITINKELTEFRFLANHTAWCANSAQGSYSKKTISTMGSGIERPLTLRVDDHTYVAIAEAALVDYARMKLSQSEESPFSVLSELSSSVEANLPLRTPWRVIMIAENPGQLLENNDILLNLNEPNAIKDTSWIKPGKVIREISLTTKGGKALVDFAVQHNLQYVHFDAGWYGDEYSSQSDARTVTVDPHRSPGPLDLREVIRYAEDYRVGVILYVNRRALEKQLDTILPLYQEWGVKGVKYGFVNVGSQKWTTWLHKAVRKAAEHQLMVDVHDEYRPTGYSRTYPNLMTQEGIRGDEARPSSEQTLTVLFTRMLAGAGDHTVCYFNSRVDEDWSHAYQLAKSVCFYSPWQYLYWYDRPAESPQHIDPSVKKRLPVISEEPELEFFDAVPTTWDDTKVIHGSIGEYAVIARQSGEDWFLGCMNNGDDRKLKVPLDFLQADKKYIAHIYSDDPKLNTRTHVKIKRYMVSASTVLDTFMQANGGQAIRIVPALVTDHFPPYDH
ncbi:MAG: alpha-glucosidase [Verrucomicrobia bacterium]|jgi:alpha-glucosidase|nr:alpha-glucosidase [Verrucomicrobiota bacterium]